MEAHDKFLYEVSKEDQTPDIIYDNQQVIFANDNSNSNYSSNQITFDLSSFYNTSSLIDWRSAYLQIPLVTCIDATGASADMPNLFSLKNGYLNIVNSIQVECSNTTVNQISNNVNFYNNFKVFTNKSKDWFETVGPSEGFYGLDSHNSWRYTKDGVNSSVGSTNNIPGFDQASVVGTALQGYIPGNESYFNRIRSYTRPADVVTGVLYPNGTSDLINIGNINTMGMDYVDKTDGPLKLTYYNNAIIRLGEIADFFNQLNLSRCYIRLIVNVNVGTIKYGTTTLNAIPSSISEFSFSYNTCPFNISQAFTNNPMTGCTAIRASIGIVRSRFGDGSEKVHNFKACRIYAPQVLLNAEKEKLYRMNNSQKLLCWKDCFSTVLTEQGPSSQVNYVISNGLSRLCGILAIPMLSALGNMPTDISGYRFSPSLSPWASEPSTTSPLMSLYNFNFYVGGKALLPSNLIYNFNVFNDQFLGVNSLNGGGLISGDLCSGAIDYAKWSNNYRYYYLDANRRNESDNSPKSITVQFQNNNTKAIDVYFFCIFERQAMLDVVTGQLEML